jgi:tRNA threonylcarbamoyladenosine biosynthesis protein TsaE
MDSPHALVLATDGAQGTRTLARRLAGALRAGDLLVLDGPLGAGKTTFTQGLGEGLGVRGPVASPTFVISRVHPSLHGGPALVHVDAYRLGGGADIDDLDLDSDLRDAVMVVEWGRDVVEQLSDSHLLVELERTTGGEALAEAGAEPAGDELDEDRTLTLSFAGPAWDGARIEAVRAALAPTAGASAASAAPQGETTGGTSGRRQA